MGANEHFKILGANCALFCCSSHFTLQSTCLPLQHIVDSKFSVGSGDGHLPPVSEDDLKTPVAERSPQLPTSSNEHTPVRSQLHRRRKDAFKVQGAGQRKIVGESRWGKGHAEAPGVWGTCGAIKTAVRQLTERRTERPTHRDIRESAASDIRTRTAEPHKAAQMRRDGQRRTQRPTNGQAAFVTSGSRAARWAWRTRVQPSSLSTQSSFILDCAPKPVFSPRFVCCLASLCLSCCRVSRARGRRPLKRSQQTASQRTSTRALHRAMCSPTAMAWTTRTRKEQTLVAPGVIPTSHTTATVTAAQCLSVTRQAKATLACSLTMAMSSLRETAPVVQGKVQEKAVAVAVGCTRSLLRLPCPEHGTRDGAAGRRMTLRHRLSSRVAGK